MERNFMEMLNSKFKENKHLCIGLDIDMSKIPIGFLKKHRDRTDAHVMKLYNQYIIEQTHDIVCAYKPNSAFYEAIGAPGFKLMSNTIKYVKDVSPSVPVIDDAKRGDIGTTNNKYVASIFGPKGFEADAVTVHPYLGSEAMKPFLDQKDKGIIVLCATSNSGSGEFQDPTVVIDGISMPYYQYVTKTVREIWNYNNNCLLVAGATHPEKLAHIRRRAGNMILLNPGLGTQGGEVQKTVEAAMDSDGSGFIANVSRAIIYAENIREEALKYHNEILLARNNCMAQ
jgi:orotidine-5'-phosphate decarboxylase